MNIIYAIRSKVNIKIKLCCPLLLAFRLSIGYNYVIICKGYGGSYDKAFAKRTLF